ncbi:MAG: hypothetical protein BJ554DRAFT_2230, partial [Olpidium bornovanus]
LRLVRHTRVPDLRLNYLPVNGYAPGGELDADRGLRFEIELVAGEPGEKVGLPYSGVPDEDDWETFARPGPCGRHSATTPDRLEHSGKHYGMVPAAAVRGSRTWFPTPPPPSPSPRQRTHRLWTCLRLCGAGVGRTGSTRPGLPSLPGNGFTTADGLRSRGGRDVCAKRGRSGGGRTGWRAGAAEGALRLGRSGRAEIRERTKGEGPGAVWDGPAGGGRQIGATAGPTRGPRGRPPTADLRCESCGAASERKRERQADRGREVPGVVFVGVRLDPGRGVPGVDNAGFSACPAANTTGREPPKPPQVAAAVCVVRGAVNLCGGRRDQSGFDSCSGVPTRRSNADRKSILRSPPRAPALNAKAGALRPPAAWAPLWNLR